MERRWPPGGLWWRRPIATSAMWRYRCMAACATRPSTACFCHNPSNTDAAVRGSAVVAADKAAPAQGHQLQPAGAPDSHGRESSRKPPLCHRRFRGQPQRFQRCSLSGDEPHGHARGYAQLLYVPRERQRTESAHRPQSGGRSSGTDQSDPTGSLGLHWLSRGRPNRLARVGEHHGAWGELYSLPQLRSRVLCWRGTCAILKLSCFSG